MFSRRGLLPVLLGVLVLIPRFGRIPLAHRLFVPLLVAYLIWERRDRLAVIPRETNPAGLLVTAIGATIGTVGFVRSSLLLEPLGVVTAFVGVGFWRWGVPMMRVIAFPAAFSLFLIPWQDVLIPLLSAPMRAFTALAATRLATWTGLSSRLDGYRIVTPEMTFVVAMPCSGLQALMAFLAMSSLFAYFTKADLRTRWLLFLSGVPMALLLNTVRVWIIVWAAHLFGRDVALRFFHEYSAPLLFMMMIVGLQSMKGRCERAAEPRRLSV